MSKYWNELLRHWRSGYYSNQLDSAFLNTYIRGLIVNQICPRYRCVFWALLRQKWVPGPRWGSLQCSPNLLADEEGARLPSTRTPGLGPSGLELRSFGPSVPIVPILRNDHWTEGRAPVGVWEINANFQLRRAGMHHAGMSSVCLSVCRLWRFVFWRNGTS